MATHLEYSQNHNGKLFNESWGDVRRHNPEKYYVGAILDVTYKGKPIGRARVQAMRTFSYRKITDVVAYLDFGKSAAYMAKVLQTMYKDLGPDDQLDHIVLQWIQREEVNQFQLLKEWWNNKVIMKQPNIQPAI